MPGIVDSSFVRQDFYSEPPVSGATAKEWTDWAAKDDHQASAAKAQFTKAQKHAEVPEHLMGSLETVKVGGKFTQRQSVGFTGSADEGTLAQEAICPKPSPEALVDIKSNIEAWELLRHKRAGNRSATMDGGGVVIKLSKSARRRANKKRRSK